MSSYEGQYSTLLRNVLSHGAVREDRTGVGTFSMFAPPQLRIDLREGFPMLTTRKMGWKLVIKELLWFLRGQTDNRLLQAQGVHIWDGNTSREFLDKLGLTDLREGDAGAIYGHQWRHWGAPYVNCETDYSGQGFDQVAYVEGLLRDNPSSRRILLSGWDPRQFDRQVLPACHSFVQFYVAEEFLDCQLYGRSSDLVLGLPVNVASYAALAMLFAKRAGLTARNLIVTLGDAHIYTNHVEGVLKLLDRMPSALPRLTIDDSVVGKKIEEVQLEDFSLEGYSPADAIRMPMAV